MENSILVERVIAFMYLIIGLSFLLQRKMWIESFKALIESPRRSMFIAFIVLPVGLVIVFTHNSWQLAPELFVTLIGWCTVLKAILFLFVPGLMTKCTPNIEKIGKLLPIWGIVVVLLCGWIIFRAYCGCG